MASSNWFFADGSGNTSSPDEYTVFSNSNGAQQPSTNGPSLSWFTLPYRRGEQQEQEPPTEQTSNRSSLFNLFSRNDPRTDGISPRTLEQFSWVGGPSKNEPPSTGWFGTTQVPKTSSQPELRSSSFLFGATYPVSGGGSPPPQTATGGFGAGLFGFSAREAAPQKRSSMKALREQGTKILKTLDKDGDGNVSINEVEEAGKQAWEKLRAGYLPVRDFLQK